MTADQLEVAITTESERLGMSRTDYAYMILAFLNNVRLSSKGAQRYVAGMLIALVARWLLAHKPQNRE